MSTSNFSLSSPSTWHRLLEDRQAALSREGIELPTFVVDEASFRSAFETLGRSQKEKQCTKLLVQLRFGPINSFAGAVDSLERFDPPNNLAALTSTGVFVAIKLACDCGITLSRIVELLGELHSAVPHIDAGLSRSPSEIHDPLHKIFSTYVDCLLLIISDVKTGQPSLNKDRFVRIENSIAEAVQLFKREGETFLRLTQSVRHSRGNDQQYESGSLSPYASSPRDGGTARFEVLQLLGRGSEGEVHKVREVTTNVVYARKQILVRGQLGDTYRTEEQVRREVNVMENLQHLHIVQVLFWLKGPESCSIFMKPSADSNLRTYLETCSDRGYPDQDISAIIPWFGCLLNALAFAHQHKITHRDIKPSNILVKDGHIYLADFGEAKDYSLQAMSITGNHMVCGTPVYRAPEVTPGNPRGLPADIFSLGCVFSEMLTVCSKRSLKEYEEWRKVPELEFPLMFRKNLNKVMAWMQSELHGGLEELVDPMSYIIKLMLKEDPVSRITAQKSWSWLVNNHLSVKLYCDYH